MTKEQILQRYFGYTHFREGQEALIDSSLNGRDVLGLMPTGAGKSICFQVPALLFDGITIVISPLISLMKDQVQALIANGVPAAYINSALSPVQTHKAIENARSGKYKIIYVAPERLAVPEFLAFSASANISMVTVDEAHCVSQWGQDFRPSYLNISAFVDALPRRPILSAFTATATDDVKQDIIRLLDLRQPYIEATGFDRENLYFEIQKPKDKYRAVVQYLEGNPGRSGIIYCATRKTVEQVCADLQSDHYQATRYHAGLPEQERAANQDDFLYDRKTIMVATNAFGMGIDKSNVGFVIHYNMPKNIESYYQEAGRAGRDGTPADCILLYGGQDVVTNQFLIERSNEQSELTSELLELVREKDRQRLQQMTYYCHTTECLRAYLLGYFGDRAHSYCGNCSNCKTSFETVDILTDSKKILSCIHRMHERYGVQMLIDTLRGSKNQKIQSLHLDQLSTYGIMKETPQSRIREIISYLVLNGYILLSTGEFPVVKLGQGYQELLSSDQPLWMKVAVEPEHNSGEKSAKRRTAGQAVGELNQDLLSKLKMLRFSLAAKQKVPAFVIFSDATLVDMCRKRPTNEEEMLAVSGVGAVKFERYGVVFLRAISEQNPQANLSLSEETAELSPEELCAYVQRSFQPSCEAVSVSILADMINALLLQKSSFKISAVRLAKFYEEKGLLHQEPVNGKPVRVTSETGQLYEIATVERIDPNGARYRQNLYGPPAQQWAVEHLQELLRSMA